jgi:integrase
MGRPVLELGQIEAIAAEFIAEGVDRGGKQGDPWAPKHARNVRESLKWWWDVTGWKTLSEINLRDAQRHLAAKLNPRTGRGIVGKTKNEIFGVLANFCGYARRLEYAPKDWKPLDGFRRYNQAPTRIARDYAPHEFQALLRESPPLERLAYIAAAITLARFSALASRKVRDLLPTGAIHFGRASTKGRREQTKPLPRWFYRLLQEDAEGRGMEEPLFRGLVGHYAGKTVQMRLRAAGVPIRTADGVLHFHGIKAFAVNQLFDTGADLKTVQDLAEHLDARLTLTVYGRQNARAQGAAVEAFGDRLRPMMGDDQKSNEEGTTGMGHAIGLGFARGPVVGVAGFEPTPKTGTAKVTAGTGQDKQKKPSPQVRGSGQGQPETSADKQGSNNDGENPFQALAQILPLLAFEDVAALVDSARARLMAKTPKLGLGAA